MNNKPTAPILSRESHLEHSPFLEAEQTRNENGKCLGSAMSWSSARNEELNKLRNENFNLKLRLYLLEENNKGATHSSKSATRCVATNTIGMMNRSFERKTQPTTQHGLCLKTLQDQAKIEKLIARIAELEVDIKKARNQIKEKSMEEKLPQMPKDLDKDKIQMLEMKHELQNTQESLLSCEAKVQELALENSDLIEKVTLQNEFKLLFVDMMNYFSEQLNICFEEKRKNLNSMQTVIPELKSQVKLIMNMAASVQKLAISSIKILNSKASKCECSECIPLKNISLRNKNHEESEVELKSKFDCFDMAN